MNAIKADIIAQLQKEILSLQGFKQSRQGMALDFGLGPINDAFPGSVFPVGAVHEFCCEGPEGASATGGFVAGILSTLMRNKGACIWISSSRTIFPPALKSF